MYTLVSACQAFAIDLDMQVNDISPSYSGGEAFPDESCAVSRRNSNGNVRDLRAVARRITLAQNICNDVIQTKTCKYSYYGRGDGFDGQIGYCGGFFNTNEMTVALPAGTVFRPENASDPTPPGKIRCGSMVRLVNPDTGARTMAWVTDTGGFAKYGRCVDVSHAVSRRLGYQNTTKEKPPRVRMEVCGFE